MAKEYRKIKIHKLKKSRRHKKLRHVLVRQKMPLKKFLNLYHPRKTKRYYLKLTITLKKLKLHAVSDTINYGGHGIAKDLEREAESRLIWALLRMGYNYEEAESIVITAPRKIQIFKIFYKKAQ